MSEEKDVGFPKAGHYDPWLVEALQKVVYETCGVQLYPEFPSASAFLETPESFGFVILFSKELGMALQQRLSSLPVETKRR